MKTTDWLLKLKSEGVLTVGQSAGKEYLHLNTPCKINISEDVTKKLRTTYDPEKEIGGMLIASPKHLDGETFLEINDVVFVKNVSENPFTSYRPDSDEWKTVIKNTFDNVVEKTFPIQFHTHPTHSNNLVNEMLNYVYQSNTSEQDQKVSNLGYKVGDLNIILPDCLVLCNGKIADKMFVGFYNGLIAPIEFESHRKEEINKAMQTVFESVSEWAKRDKNGLILFGGSILFLFLLFRFPKAILPMLFMLSVTIPSLVNSNKNGRKYFAQVGDESAIIEIP
jgi:hypothetical protein